MSIDEIYGMIPFFKCFLDDDEQFIERGIAVDQLQQI